MTRNEAITQIASSLPQLSDEHVQVLAEMAASWADAAARPAAV